MNLSFEYPAKTKIFLAERSEDTLFVRTKSKRAVTSKGSEYYELMVSKSARRLGRWRKMFKVEKGLVTWTRPLV